MDATPPPSARVRWLVAGALLPAPSGRRFPLTEHTLAEHLGPAARGLRVLVQDRIGSGDASSYEVSFDGPHAFQLDRVLDAIPDLRVLRQAHAALTGAKALDAEEAFHLKSAMGSGRLATAMAEALRGARSPQDARRAGLDALEEVLFATARDILQLPPVARLEAAWRGLHWLASHCPPSAGIDLEVLDVAPEQRLEALERCLEAPPLQRPDAGFLLEPIDDLETLRQLAALGEAASLPLVVAISPALLGDGSEPAARPSEAWSRLRAEGTSRWLCATLNPVVLMAEHQGDVRRECFTSPALAVAALLAASFRDTRTFARLVGPGSAIHAPAVWRPTGSATLATQALLSLHEQQRLAARGVLGVSGWWDSDNVLLAAAPTVYGGRDAAPLAAQLLTGRLVRLAQAIAERLPPGASNDAVAAVFSRAAEAFLSGGPGRTCQLHGRLVPTGPGTQGVHVRAALKPELAGTHVQLEFLLPLGGEPPRLP
jgi:hypothetical protein